MANFKELSLDELTEALQQAEAGYVNDKFDHALTPMTDPSLLGKMRKDIARIHTELRARELATATPADLAKRDRMRTRRRN